MPTLRDNPYGNFKFIVELDGQPVAFQEVTLPELSIEVIEYRDGSDAPNSTLKMPGLSKYGNVTLKRGVIGATNLYDWINATRNGDPKVRRTVTIKLLDESHQVVLSWTLFRAFPVKHAFAPLLSTGKEVLIEELVLTYDGIELG